MSCCADPSIWRPALAEPPKSHQKTSLPFRPRYWLNYNERPSGQPASLFRPSLGMVKQYYRTRTIRRWPGVWGCNFFRKYGVRIAKSFAEASSAAIVWWRPNHAAVGHDADPADMKALAKTVDDRQLHGGIDARRFLAPVHAFNAAP